MLLTLDSPAKINLGLWVGPRRADGFHEVVTTLAPLELHDTVQIRPAAAIKVSTDSRAAPGGPANLAHRAAAAFLAASRVRSGCRIHIRKRVPVGAGLGGGSSNAATVLRGLNQLFGSPLPRARLARLAASLGSDVPFFLAARPCVARGRGERLRPVSLPRLTVLLYSPPYPVSTAWAYRQIDLVRARNPGLTRFRLSPKILGLRLRQGELDKAAPEVRNSFEDVVFRRHPDLARVKQLLLDSGARLAAVSGSGSTVYGLVNARDWQDPMAALKRHGLHCILTRTRWTVGH